MATLAALLTDVYSLTNRPDLVAESTLAVKMATLKAHQSDFFFRDIAQLPINLFIAPTPAVFTVPLTSFTRWRAWSTITKYDPVTADIVDSANAQIEIVPSAMLFDSYQLKRTNIAWNDGVSVNIRFVPDTTLTFPYNLLFKWYQNQDITNAAAMGWISDNHPYCIVTEAARTIFKTIGQDQQAAYYESLVKEQYQELKISNIVAVGS